MVAKQTAIGGLHSDEELEAEVEAGYVWREQLWSAMRQFVAGYIANGLKGYDAVAHELNARWERKGRGVTSGVLRAALLDNERNNFRLEWVDWFAARDRDIADLLGRRVKPMKTAEQMLDDVIAEMRDEMSHKRVEAVLRKARTR